MSERDEAPHAPSACAGDAHFDHRRRHTPPSLRLDVPLPQLAGGGLHLGLHGLGGQVVEADGAIAVVGAGEDASPVGGGDDAPPLHLGADRPLLGAGVLLARRSLAGRVAALGQGQPRRHTPPSLCGVHRYSPQRSSTDTIRAPGS